MCQWHRVCSRSIRVAMTRSQIAPAPDDPQPAIVDEYLRLLMIPDPDAARAYFAPTSKSALPAAA